jgi:hypothetical protein
MSRPTSPILEPCNPEDDGEVIQWQRLTSAGFRLMILILIDLGACSEPAMTSYPSGDHLALDHQEGSERNL